MRRACLDSWMRPDKPYWFNVTVHDGWFVTYSYPFDSAEKAQEYARYQRAGYRVRVIPKGYVEPVPVKKIKRRKRGKS